MLGHLTRWGFISCAPLVSGGPTSTSSVNTLDAIGEHIGQSFMLTRSGTITHVAVPLYSTTGSPAFSVSLETVSANGVPSGTDYGGSSPATGWVESVQGIYDIELSAPATATPGDMVSVTVRATSTDGSNKSSFYADGFFSYMSFANKYAYYGFVLNVGRTLMHGWGVKYSDGLYDGIVPVSMSVNKAVEHTTSPDEIGAKFVAPENIDVYGIYFRAGNMGAAGAHVAQVVLYDSSDNVLFSFESDDIIEQWDIYLAQHVSTPVRIVRGETYRVTYKPISGSILDTYPIFMQFASQEVRDYSLMGAPDPSWIVTERTDDGAWTDYDATYSTGIGIIVDAVELLTPVETTYLDGAACWGGVS